MLISVDRWIAVKWLFGNRTLMTKKRVCIGALSAWITSVSLVSAVFVFKLYGGIYIFRVLTITGIIVPVYLNSSIFLLYRKSIKMMKVDRRFTGHCQRRKCSERIVSLKTKIPWLQYHYQNQALSQLELKKTEKINMNKFLKSLKRK